MGNTPNSKRNSHYLRPSKRVGSPRSQIALAVVASSLAISPDARSQSLTVDAWSASAWITGGGKERVQLYGDGKDALSWWRWLAGFLRKGECTWIWQLGACSGLTLLGFWEMLERGEWVLDGCDPCDSGESEDANREQFRGMAVIEDTPTIIMARPTHGPGMVKWVDAGNLGVEGWEGIVGKDIARAPVSLSGGLQAESPAEVAATRSVALRRFLVDWERTVSDLKLGGLRATAAAQAWHGWRISAMQEPILCHNDETALALEREAMHAGRCEAFRLGLIEGPVYQLDIASHYPACAVAGLLPVRHKWTGQLTHDEIIKHSNNGWLIIARVNVDARDPVYPCRDKGLIAFPEGRFTTTLCGPELHLAISRGEVGGGGLCALYEGGKPFNGIINALWAEKEAAEQAGNLARRACCKSLLNSLIGKTAQRGWRWVDHPYPFIERPFSTWQGQHPQTGEPCTWRSIAWHSQYEEQTGEHPDSCPAIAAWVMSLARVRLWSLISEVGYGNCYYCDTDSLFTTQEGFHNLARRGWIGGGGIGEIRVKMVHDHLDIRGFRSYYGDSGMVCSGVPKDATLRPGGDWSFWVPERLKDSMRQRRAPRAALNAYRMPVGREYRHGEVGEDGWVKPFRLERW
jgi:hypothetical protein